jgi:1-deoxy-D-xylulose-5-phosphate reductoisomerase
MSDQVPASQPTRIAVLGSTGSIGTQTLDVIRAHPDRFRAVALAAGHQVELLQRQVAEFQPRLISLDPELSIEAPTGSTIVPGREGLLACASDPDVDVVVVATSGIASLEAVLAAARLGKVIALANKEALVCAADIILPMARENGAELRPVDSEHSAIWQAMGSLSRADVRRLILTASGGPFRSCPLSELANVTPGDALRHPTWNMGAKITIDSATLVNKGLEVIEAHRLFGVPYDRIDVVIHPESVIHSMVEFADGSTIAQLSAPDMRLPIQYALTAPEHAPREAPPLDLAGLGALTFAAPDRERFPALGLCRAAGVAGGSTSAALCAADEVAVDAFVNRKIPFTDIPRVLQETFDRHQAGPIRTLDDVESIMTEATAVANEIVRSR